MLYLIFSSSSCSCLLGYFGFGNFKIFRMSNILILFIIVLASPQILSKKFQDDQKPEWAKKDIRDYNEADLERLLDQWEVMF